MHPAIEAAENWHRKNASAGEIENIVEVIKESKPFFEKPEYLNRADTNHFSLYQSKDSKGEPKLILQFWGNCINLYNDGTYSLEDTSG